VNPQGGRPGFDLCLIDISAGPANVMQAAIPSAADAATQVCGKHTDNLLERSGGHGRRSQQSDGLVSGA
jgi:hypothetical protein